MKLCILFIIILVSTLIFRGQSDSFESARDQYSTRQQTDKYSVANKSEIKLEKKIRGAVKQQKVALYLAPSIDKQQHIIEYKELLLNSRNVGERINAIKQLQQIGGQEALTTIGNGLGDKNAAVQEQVIESLSQMNAKEVAHLFGQVLLGSAGQALKLQALDAMSLNMSYAGIALLKYIEQHEADELLKIRAIDILEYYAALDGFQLELETESSQDYYDLIQQSIFLPPEEQIAALQSVLQNASDENLREEAVLSLANSDEETALNIIEEVLMADKSSNIRLQAMQILSSAGHDNVSILGRVLLSDSDPELRLEAVNLIALEQTDASRAFLEHALNDPDMRVREMAEKYAF